MIKDLVDRIIRTLVRLLSGMRQWLLNQQWFTSRLLPAIPRPIRWALRRLYFLPIDLIERLRGERGDLVPPMSAIFTGSVDGFKSSGQAHFSHFVKHGALSPASQVLDVGCGFGRLAVPLTTYLNEDGGYEGMDIVPEAIEWATQNISSRYPNFHFMLSDIYNAEYNPQGRLEASEYRFLYDDDTFDLVIANSVFTHLLPAETEQYISEIARVLKKGGRCWATFSLIDEESKAAMEQGQSDTHFKHHVPPYWTVSQDVPELAVAYDAPYVRNLYERNGVDGDYTIHYGHWAKRPSKTAEMQDRSQDIIVSTKQ